MGTCQQAVQPLSLVGSASSHPHGVTATSRQEEVLFQVSWSTLTEELKLEKEIAQYGTELSATAVPVTGAQLPRLYLKFLLLVGHS